MAAPDSITCQYERTYSALAHLGAVPVTRSIRQCAERPTSRVRLRVTSAGMHVWIKADTCGNHCVALEQLPEHDFSWPVST
jgi:hypothetical protein